VQLLCNHRCDEFRSRTGQAGLPVFAVGSYRCIRYIHDAPALSRNVSPSVSGTHSGFAGAYSGRLKCAIHLRGTGMSEFATVATYSVFVASYMVFALGKFTSPRRGRNHVLRLLPNRLAGHPSHATFCLALAFLDSISICRISMGARFISPPTSTRFRPRRCFSATWRWSCKSHRQLRSSTTPSYTFDRGSRD